MEETLSIDTLIASLRQSLDSAQKTIDHLEELTSHQDIVIGGLSSEAGDLQRLLTESNDRIAELINENDTLKLQLSMAQARADRWKHEAVTLLKQSFLSWLRNRLHQNIS